MGVNPIELELMVRGFRDQFEEVYITEIGEDDFIWRTLGRKEYREIVELAASEDDAFERICNTCVLWPQMDFSGPQAKAYTATQLAPQILDESGFGVYQKDMILLGIFREQLQSFDKQAEIIINAAFPYISFEEMENWTKEKLMKYVARAEWQLTTLRGVPLKLTPTGVSEDGEPQAPQEEPDYMEVAKVLRQRGEDPMFVMRGLWQKPKPNYVERPLIGGHQQTDSMLAGLDAWREGGFESGRYDIVQQQVQKISRR